MLVTDLRRERERTKCQSGPGVNRERQQLPAEGKRSRTLPGVTLPVVGICRLPMPGHRWKLKKQGELRCCRVLWHVGEWIRGVPTRTWHRVLSPQRPLHHLLCHSFCPSSSLGFAPWLASAMSDSFIFHSFLPPRGSRPTIVRGESAVRGGYWHSAIRKTPPPPRGPSCMQARGPAEGSFDGRHRRSNAPGMKGDEGERRNSFSRNRPYYSWRRASRLATVWKRSRFVLAGNKGGRPQRGALSVSAIR